MRPSLDCNTRFDGRLRRRDFIKHLAFLSAAGSGTAALAGKASEHAAQGPAAHHGPADPMGVLVDINACVGCRQCEYACKQAAGFDPGTRESYDDTSVFRVQRRPMPDGFTVVNCSPNPMRSRQSRLRQAQLHALQLRRVRVGVHRRRTAQAGERRGHLRRLEVHRLPLLHGGLSVSDSRRTTTSSR